MEIIMQAILNVHADRVWLEGHRFPNPAIENPIKPVLILTA